MAFDQSATAGDTLVAGSIHSPNYATGSSGWSINRDGSAEFQNVLVRGTITGSTIIGSTIIGGDFRSTNYVPGTSGFDLNSTTNQIEINTGFRVGGATGQHITLGISGANTTMQLFTGIAAETAPAAIGVTTVTQGAIVTPDVIFQSAQMGDGATVIGLLPATGTGAGDFRAQIAMGTLGTTAPSGALTAGVAFLGAANSNTADTWNLTVINENSVLNGAALGAPALILGNTITPQSRLFVSVNELLSVDGLNSTEMLFLNTNTGQTVAGGVVSPWLRQQSTAYTGANITPGTGAYASSGI